MKDFAISENADVQAQLDRLGALSLPSGRLGLDTVRELCARLGDPQEHLPPVFHVAGTNGKGSTCSYLRHILEAEGLTVHSATKPHLVRYNERIRIAGQLIEDDLLAALLKEVLDAGHDLEPSFFEVTTVATFLAYARTPADVCVIETGLGGRLDATNVMPTAAVCGISTLGIDHEAFLLTPEEGVPADPMARIAFEKASIAKPGVPLVTMAYPAVPGASVAETAARIGAPLIMRGRDWDAQIAGSIHYRDAAGELTLPLPALPGEHQAENAALAVAMLRHQSAMSVSLAAMGKGIVDARWPARLQRLGQGPLTDLAGQRTIWLDGGHNPDAGRAIARHLASQPPVHLIMGMLANKDPSAILKPLADRALSLSVVPAPGHDAHQPEDFAPFTSLPVRSFATVPEALAALPPQGDVLIVGSLYLAGEVLRLNAEIPD
ncbi:MAG: bifunctional folylpolyglutamate synthase/dihydrofolate synthase [Novosphingobium sp. 16-62-11]|uniref:bifunctional folylpolyglutamate synthase/dihydrofolate synthase n=1 Tax=Novosphingobium sp. 17-62-19 TaxID=1970406 RepID=UPI000BCFAD53|nr:folylpolyglutamate synthase/dihydrofolate synthase family protein [Novosphingobium sp. 17-62-19]OYX93604.1 MAG: bifunctional folylpolyglutamate synthase/dihydrofolate synthase [Novosphingobium sp. 35-62-5]OYZ42044.1 MAG: bifunctional folylpolyglutamate synthase/dihydrofolate synthase [Novosphingobium sp. 16-62-11]OZA19050.1 MAG: bifunctional folylpolyglutamate synthase/dihydrofolate synthase [Novosphingobium sp. 17-62-19]HQS98473.1 folylpolyglutamate synthase/dihydrofolate synthase family pr